MDLRADGKRFGCCLVEILHVAVPRRDPRRLWECRSGKDLSSPGNRELNFFQTNSSTESSSSADWKQLWIFGSILSLRSSKNEIKLKKNLYSTPFSRIPT